MSEPTQNKVITSDSLEFLKQLKDYQADIIFADPPYALGSEVVIRQDGKVDYAKASDFMNKWEMPTGEYWEKWFIEAYRTLKYGGYLLMYGMDRQLLLFKYYASLAGFQEQQSIYWYYISNFPKATDLALQIDKNAGLQGQRGVGGFNVSGKGEQDNRKSKLHIGSTTDGSKQEAYKEPKSFLAKKYKGYKYSVAPLKQTCETIMVFKKPNKTGSVLHDTLAMENGDETITCSALNIDGNRVGVLKSDLYDLEKRQESRQLRTNDHTMMSSFTNEAKHGVTNLGRYPAQTFIDSQVAEKLDRQSPNEEGCSKILHKCDYEELDFDLFIYEPKVDSGERNNGLYGMEEKQYSHDGREKPIENAYQRNNSVAQNNHPTLKPIDLNHKILNLFKTPNEQVIIYPFAGSGSEIIGGLKANFQNWYACEINQDYVDIANARIKHYKENEYIQLSLI